MSVDHSSGPSAPAKPNKPRPDFPLFALATGRWAKKIRGKLHYFGPWGDPAAAEARYNEQKDALHKGLTPRDTSEALTVFRLCGQFLTLKESRRDSGELSPVTYRDYVDACQLLIKSFGKRRLVSDLRPDDFAKLRDQLAKKWGPVRVRDLIQRTRSVFKFALESELVDKPMMFGPGFARPSRKTMRLEKAKKGPKLFTAPQVRALIRQADQPLKAMILLGANCAFGNSDVGRLPLSALDLPRGWVNFPRPKTGVPRRCPLWPETVAALREAIAARSEPRTDESKPLVFVTRLGNSWHKDVMDNPVSKEFTKVMKALKIYRGKGLGFYTLRHVFETIGGAAKDQVAVDAIMGHADESMAAVYRERVDDDRLRAVTDHVRTWLFGVTGQIE